MNESIKNLSVYKSILFDCDGVILNSNHIKTNAFELVASSFGKLAAKKLVEFHKNNGGVSRYVKFQHFLDHILPIFSPNVSVTIYPSHKQLIETYASEVKSRLLKCEIDSALFELKKSTKNTKWAVITGGDQTEVRSIFQQRNLSQMFEIGIFGSPDKKEDILQREINSGAIGLPAIFIGDSKYDYLAACSVGIDFVFLKHWSEIGDIEEFISHYNLFAVDDIEELMRVG